MGKLFDSIDENLAGWLTAQRVFFVSTAPLSADHHINLSPKGLDTFRILGPREVAYLDLTGSGAETIAHVRENGRIVFMFCAFAGPPKIVRLHGRADVITPDDAGWAELAPHFPEVTGTRSIIRARLTRIGDSCGYGVPLYEHVEDRDTLVRYSENKGDEGLREYRNERNERSIDGLPAWDPR